MIQNPPWPVLGGGPRITGTVVALSPTDGELVPPVDGNILWTPGIGWEINSWAIAWAASFANLISTFELDWGQLQDKLYWYITAPTDPEAADAPDYLSGALLFQQFIGQYLNS